MNEDLIIGQCWVNSRDGRTIRILAIGKQWLLVRIKGCYPFPLSISELRNKYQFNKMLRKDKKVLK